MKKVYRLELCFDDPDLPDAIHYVACDNIREAENKLYRMLNLFNINNVVHLTISLYHSDTLPTPLPDGQ